MKDSNNKPIAMQETPIRRYGLGCVALGWLCLCGMFAGYSFLAYAQAWIDSPWASYGDLAREARNVFALMLVASVCLAIAAIILRRLLAGALLLLVSATIGLWGAAMNVMTALAGHGYPYFDF